MDEIQTWNTSQLKADVDFFVTTLEEVHPEPYFSLPQSRFVDRRDKIKGALAGPLTRDEFFRRIAPLASALNDEHVSISIPEEEYKQHIREGGLVFPFDLLFSENNAYVVADSTQDGIPPGSEALAINGMAIHDLIQEFTSYVSGTRLEQRLSILEKKQNFRKLLYLAYPSESFDIVYRSPGTGGQKTLTIPGVPGQTADEPPFTYRSLPQEKTGLITFKKFVDLKAFKTFLRDTFQHVRDEGIAHLIIDIRDNAGGTSSLGDALLSYLTDKPFRQFSTVEFKVSKGLKENIKKFIPGFIRWLPVHYLVPLGRKIWTTPEGGRAVLHFKHKKPTRNPLRFDGDIYVLISPYVMSSASMFAGTIKEYDIGTLVGQASGGSPTNYGNVWHFELPNTGLIAEIPSSLNHGNGTGPVVPHHAVDKDIMHRVQGIDIEIEFTKKLIASDHQASTRKHKVTR